MEKRIQPGENNLVFEYLHKYAIMEGMNDREVQNMANLLKALGEFNRLSLVYRLCQCQVPQNAMCLCECCCVDASVTSRNLKILAQQGVLTSKRKGREKTYSLNRSQLAEKLRALADKVENKA